MPIPTLQTYYRIMLSHFSPFIRENFILMHDNARPHVTRCVVEYLQEVGIQVMDWPPWGPNMNPIEHAWDELQRHVRSGDPILVTLNDLKIALRGEWENIGDGVIQNLIFSVPGRIRALLDTRGRPMVGYMLLTLKSKNL